MPVHLVRKSLAGTLAALALAAASPAVGATGATKDAPPAVPANRGELKQALENSKASQPRLPLPPLTDAEQEKAAKGDWSVVNNGRMRRFYLLSEFAGAGFTREPDPGMSLGNPFQTMIFWIVSRGNNCTYCLGHQESKLAAAGVGEDQVAALDGDWSEFEPKQRAAFVLARKLTFEPHKVVAEDLDRLRPGYTDKQILEIVFVTANFNAMNRWTGALKIPQEAHREYLTPTASKYKDMPSRNAPADPAGPALRPALESASMTEATILYARTREPRLPLVSEDEARAALPKDAGVKSGPVPQWVRLLANFPKAGAARIVMHLASEEKGHLDAPLRARIAYLAARHDRAWYAVDQAAKRLHALGQTDEQIAALADPATAPSLTPADRAALAFAVKLTVSPAAITDNDIEGLRKSYDDKQVAEIVHLVTEAAFFDRVTETAGLRIEN